MTYSKIRKLMIAVMMFSIIPAISYAEVVYHRGNSADPETLDQHKTSTTYEANILRDMYEGLTALNAKGETIPGVAVKWTISDDGTVYRFDLRRDSKWSNGDSVSARDFVYSFRRIMNPATGAKYATVLYPIKNAEKVNKGEMDPDQLGVRAINNRTLEIVLESPTPYFLDLLTHQTGLPVHPATVEKHGTDFVRPENIVTNGPYTLAEFIPNSHVKSVKNPNFHDARNVRIDTVYYYPTEDRSAALQRFQAGELHSNNDAPTEQFEFMKRTLGDQFRVAPYLGTYYYALNHNDPVLSNPDVRLALSMAVDREYLAEEIWGGAMVPAYSIVPPGIGNYTSSFKADYADLSMIDREEKALELLTKAGYGPSNPFTLKINYNTSENHKNTAIAIADGWKPLGVEITLENTDTKTHYAMLRDKADYDIARAGWIGDYSDPQNFLFLVESDNHGFNYANYENPAYDSLMDQAAAEVNIGKRARLLKKAETIFMGDLPFIPLLFYGSLSLVSDKLEGWEDNIQNFHPTRYMNIVE